MKRADIPSRIAGEGRSGRGRAGSTRKKEAGSAGVRPMIVLVFIISVVALGCLFILAVSKKPSRRGEPVEAVTLTDPGAVPIRKPSPTTPDPAPAAADAATATTGQPVASSAPVPFRLPATPETRQLVVLIVKPEGTNGTLAPAQVETWKSNLTHLVQYGLSGIPAIREYLEKNVDLDFGQAGIQLLGYGSARLAMLDALTQIGGPEAINVLSGVLQTTADPREIAVLAKNLEQVDPGAHRQEALDAARQTLSMAGDGKLPDRDVAPLFEVFQTYGDPSTASELLTSAEKWNYYATYAIARLPDNAGIPELVKIVQGEVPQSASARAPALQMLAQTAIESETAREALLAQVKQNALSSYDWATLELALAGNRLGFKSSVYDTSLSVLKPTDISWTSTSYGNQNFYSAPPAGGLTADQMNAQMALIDQLMGETRDPAGIQVLQRSKQLLVRRSAQLAKASLSQNQ